PGRLRSFYPAFSEHPDQWHPGTSSAVSSTAFLNTRSAESQSNGLSSAFDDKNAFRPCRKKLNIVQHAARPFSAVATKRGTCAGVKPCRKSNRSKKAATAFAQHA